MKASLILSILLSTAGYVLSIEAEVSGGGANLNVKIQTGT